MSKENKEVVYALMGSCDFGSTVLGAFSDKETATNKMALIKDSHINSIKEGVSYEMISTSEDHCEAIDIKYKGKTTVCLEVIELEKDVLCYSV